MGVQLDIKSAAARAMAEELAAATGTSIIAAVTDALRCRRDDLDAARAASDAEGRAR
jgi:hypothetical protein